jgi:hypothetical protein
VDTGVDELAKPAADVAADCGAKDLPPHVVSRLAKLTYFLGMALCLL